VPTLSWLGLIPGGFGYNVGTLQFLIAVSLATLDLLILYRVIWIPFVRNVAPEDRPYLWKAVGRNARIEREDAEEKARRGY
jgi:hypothetical protein